MKQTMLAIVSKLEKNAQLYWIKSKFEISETFFKKLSRNPDTYILVNPINEWDEINFTTAEFIYFREGVTDNPGRVFKELILLDHNLSFTENLEVHSGNLNWDTTDFYFNRLIHYKERVDKLQIKKIYTKQFSDFRIDNLGEVVTYDFLNLDVNQLEILSKDKKWALSRDELKAIKEHYFQKKCNPTDIEIEVLAQTWSEHCKHKIFNSKIYYSDSESSFIVDNLYKTYIKGSTFKINQPWAVSVFNDNAGIVDWDDNNYLAIKVETHNSPSALDPYGGALTGILGVNRDILGTGLGFKPIANTNVFCVGEYDETELLPQNIIHPKKILEGIHKGIQDGGNKSGIPTVNGSMAFDENFTGKPLVFCGTIGISPKETAGRDNKNKYHETGDLIIMSGGLVGHDGIHGATMSSVILDNQVPNSMVQIGDPFTQKKLIEFILELRDRGLIKGITDNGAGGLSSSIGEMATVTNGAIVNLERVPLKYLGLAPWEIFVSESQERMTFAILPENLELVLTLSLKFGVITNEIGVFTNTGNLELYFKEKCVGNLSMSFLHDGLPQMNLSAVWDGPQLLKPSWKSPKIKKNENDLMNILITILRDRNIASKEYFVKQYDHEVMAATMVKPFEGCNFSSPSDASVIWLKPHAGENKGVAVSCGLQYHFSHIDTKLMAMLAFDEAIRGNIATGADPQKIAVTDNFCWPDPLNSSHKLAQLVRACIGLYDIALAYKMPMISGKDSMKNDYQGDNLKISCPPTLLVTALGHVPDISKIKRTIIPSEHLNVYQIGLDFGSTYFGHFLNKYFDYSSNFEFDWNLTQSYQLYQDIHHNLDLFSSIHDISEGGMLVALVESLFLNKLGVQFENSFSIEELFSEYPSQFIVSVSAENAVNFENIFKSNSKFIGKTIKNYSLIFSSGKTMDLIKIEEAWRGKWQ